MDEQHAAESLEQHLSTWEQRAAELEKQVKRFAAAVRTLGRVAREGDLAGGANAVAAAAEANRLTAAALDEASRIPEYDVAAAFASGDYLHELAAAAKAAGVALVMRDGAISSFPVSLRLDAARSGIRVGRRLERRLRPKILADQLRRLQQAPARFNARSFAALVFRAYSPIARQSGWKPNTPGAGPVVALADIYEMLTLSPGSEYRPEEFAADLLRLDRAPDTQIGAGHRVQFAGSTGLKGGKRLTVYDETGHAHEYFAIRFMLEPGDGRSENAAAAA